MTAHHPSFFLVNSNFSSSTERCFSGNTTHRMILTAGALFWWSKSDTAEGPIHVCSASDGERVWLSPTCQKKCLNVESISTKKECMQSLLKYHGKNVVFEMSYLTQKHKIYTLLVYLVSGADWFGNKKSTIGFGLIGLQFILTANQRKCLGIYFYYTEFFF